ncbi:Putative zinc/iron permease [Septoria linicola]|uniref:Zinc/iron permease n=1 Tax=Septoria linicola TaxID=215465 RepID=A0A9Q9AM87_9PEZI|nr:Putative zinc/iron permease [Septoria linicola]
MYSKTILLGLALGVAQAQRTTYTGCNNRSENGVEVEYCFLSGIETARATYTVSGTATIPITVSASTTAAAQTTAVTDCHTHSAELFCVNGAGQDVQMDATPTGEFPAQYTDCHSHGSEQFCVGPDGEDVAVLAVAGSEPAATSAAASGDSHAHCHTHGDGTEHCEEDTAETAAAEGDDTTATDCHMHDGDGAWCTYQGEEYQLDPTPTGEIQATYTDCHAHDTTTFCLDADGEEVALLSADAEGGNEQCHFHAGVEHCVGGSGEVSCELTTRDYNIGFRVGSIFIILVTSAIGVFAPMFLNKIPGIRNSKLSFNTLMIVKQFGTGIIISTAFIHLYTHADLMFSNECIGTLGYEGTTSAIVMAGIFICFLIEYIGTRFVASRHSHEGDLPAHAQNVRDKGTQSPNASEETRDAFMAMDHHHGGANNKLSVAVMEAGIIFHSVLIGLTLVVAGDSFYRTLLVVIVFHQFFEGLALGARVALLPGAIFPSKFLMGLAFALITPIGMAIGIGVLNSFNGNNPATVITFGTLDALSAGVLVWVGVVDMWARDWVIEGGELLTSGLIKTLSAGFALVLGMILMGVLGKWA